MQSQSAGCLTCHIYGFTSTQQAEQCNNGVHRPVGLSLCGHTVVVNAVYVKTLLLCEDMLAVLHDAVKSGQKKRACNVLLMWQTDDMMICDDGVCGQCPVFAEAC